MILNVTSKSFTQICLTDFRLIKSTFFAIKDNSLIIKRQEENLTLSYCGNKMKQIVVHSSSYK